MSALVRPAPTRRSWPLVGATFSYIHDPLRMMRRQYDACGPVSETTFVGEKVTVLLGPDACGAGLRNADKALSNGLGWGEIVGPFFERGLMLLCAAHEEQQIDSTAAAFTTVLAAMAAERNTHAQPS